MKQTLKKLIPKSLFRAVEPTYHLLEAVAANIKYGFPARQLRVIGITGTNGKTTVANLTASVLEAAGYNVGLSSTAVFQDGLQRYDNELNMTVVDAFALQKLLRHMVDSGAEWAVVEVTSHALAQHRVWGLKYEVAALTNLTHDHLDYHGTMEQYAAAKMRLFMDNPRLSVLNRDDDYYEQFELCEARSKISYGMKTGDVTAANVKLAPLGSKFNLEYHGESTPVKLQLPGEFNIYNALAAASIGLGLGIKPEIVKKGLEAVEAVPGRMEKIDQGQDFGVVVDYAHTPDALEKVYTALRQATEGELIGVLGAFGGNHDLTKFAPMGKIATEMCDYVVFTDDEPYDDDPDMLRQKLIDGAGDSGNFTAVADRRRAIAAAFKRAQPGDTVVITGIGHQKYRSMAGGKVAWDDRTVAREELNRLLG